MHLLGAMVMGYSKANHTSRNNCDNMSDLRIDTATILAVLGH